MVANKSTTLQFQFTGLTLLGHILNSIKVALGIGQLCIGKLLFGGHSNKALHCVPYAQMTNAQLPMTNCQSNLY